MNIAFCINRLVLFGFGAVIGSVVRNCASPAALRFYILCADLNEEDKKQLNELLQRQGFNGAVHFIDFDAKAVFGEYRSLYKDWTTYGRLLLPTYINEPRVLYLDADLIIETDVLLLQDFSMEGKALAAVPDGHIVKTRDAAFYTQTLGLSDNQAAFNAGVLLFDLDIWRKQQITKSCIDLVAEYHTLIHSHDQTILNAFFKGEFAHLPPAFNCIWYLRNGRPKTAPRMVLHFVGSPKPWDALGSWLHDGYPIWKGYQDKIWAKYYKSSPLTLLKRTWRLRRAYIRMLIINIVMYFRNKR